MTLRVDPSGAMSSQMPRNIHIKPYGGLGNRMFQYMFALALQHEVASAEISGVHLAEWGLSCPPKAYQKALRLVVRRSDVPMAKLIKKLGSVEHIDINLRRINLRVEYYAGLLDYYRTVFPRGAGSGAAPDEVAINIRGAEILALNTTGRALRSDYVPLPLSFYEHIVNTTGLRPVFVGQIENDSYSRALRERFPSARFLNHGFGLGDFHYVRASHNIVPAVSTYSWLAAWLSESAQRIFLPAVGHYHPAVRPDCDLLPRKDGRYVIFGTDLTTWSKTAEDLERLIHAPLQEFGFRPEVPNAFWPGLRTRPIRALASLALRHSLLLTWSPYPHLF